MLQIFFRRTFFLMAILFVIPFMALRAQQKVDAVEQVSPYALEEDFDISADLSHPAWRQAESVYIQHQVQPNDNMQAWVQTKVKMLYSEQNLYIGFISEDPNPQNIRANISDRDDAFQDDYVGILLDPFNNNQ